jgi:CDP-2,3-bis-(O-geranylgeranyl)-sn-glycerol synthase
MDFGKSYRGKRILGDHKTLRGFVFAAAVGVLVFAGQRALYELYEPIRDISVFHYPSVSLWWGVLMGVGAMVGDMVKSFFKRQRDVAPGEPWFPWDKIDYTIGALIITAPLFWPGWLFALGVILLGFVISLFMDHLGYYLGMRKSRW